MYLGKYVQYKNKVGVIVDTHVGINPDLRHVLFSDQRKLTINKNNLVERSESCVVVSFEGTSYLVSPKKTIISLTTKRIMMWSNEHRERKEILELAGM